MKVAVIGAGIAGITCALDLQSHAEVTVFEKSRGVGRLATRYKDSYQFDFGAPYFRAKSTAFQDFLASYISADTVKAWHPVIGYHQHKVQNESDSIVMQEKSQYPFYVSTPKMTSLGRAMTDNLYKPIHFKTRVQKIVKQGDMWEVFAEDGSHLGCFGWVVSAMPLEQAKVIMPTSFKHTATMQACKTDACFTLMLAIPQVSLSEKLQVLVNTYHIVRFESHILEMLVVENTKHTQLNQDVYSFTLFAQNQWAEEHASYNVEEVQKLLLDEFLSIFDISRQAIVHIDMHRWMYANVRVSARSIVGDTHQCLLDKENKLLTVGDWCNHGSVEGAWQSAVSGSQELLESM